MNIIFEAIANSISLATADEGMKRHVEGFVRTNRGSYVAGLEDLDSTINFLYEVSASAVEVPHEEINAECPGAARMPARYFRFEIPQGFRAMESVVLLADCSEEQLENVRVRSGQHGFEFYTVNPAAHSEREATEGWIIVGPTGEKETPVIWTWYPGRITAGSTIENHAVKLNS